MAIRQTPTIDVLTETVAARAQLALLAAAREAGIEARGRAAQERHKERERGHQRRLMDAATDFTGYRRDCAASEARLAADLKDKPPDIVEDLFTERVYIQALRSIPTLCAEELEAVVRQQRAWVPRSPATADVTEEVLYATA